MPKAIEGLFESLTKNLPECSRASSAVDDNITTPGFVKFYIRKRVGGIVSNNQAVKLLKCAAS